MNQQDYIVELKRLQNARLGLHSLKADHNPPYGFGYAVENEGLTYALALVAERESWLISAINGEKT